ncbi:MAG: hypothetical protein ACHQXA_05715 [Gemmatimonadales bacterium]
MILAIFCVAVPLRLSAQSQWRPEDRTIVGSFNRITAVATSFTVVYVASDAAVVTWDPLGHRWGLPVAADVPGGLADVTAGLIDPLDQTLWLAERAGWIHYEPMLRRWSQGRTASPVVQIAFDQSDPARGLYLRTAAGWQLVSRGALMAEPSAPPQHPIIPTTLLDAVRENPQLNSNSAFILNAPAAPGFGTARYTVAAPAADRSGWYVGTTTLGLLFLPIAAATPERRPFGLPGSRIGALFAAPGGVWVLTERGSGSFAGLSFVSSDLSSFTWRTGDPVFGQPFTNARRLIGSDTLLWAATDNGAVAFPLQDGPARRWSTPDGLPDARVLSVAAGRGRIFFGTARGIGELSDSDGQSTLHRVARDYVDQALALAPSGDTLWVGTPRGLYAALPGESDLRQAPGWGSAFRFQTPVVALLWRADTLIALTRDEMLWREPHGGWIEGPILSATIGPLRALANDAAGLWVAGARGVGFARVGSSLQRPLMTGDALPGSVTDVAVDDQYLWVGTDAGLVRFALDAVRP